jgi:hypothetical protein
MEEATRNNLDRAERIVRASLDETTFDKCVAEGRLFDNATADRIALGPPEGPTSVNETQLAGRKQSRSKRPT